MSAETAQEFDALAAYARHKAACEARRLELDRWLQEQGAIRIQVRDLGAALEAREKGAHCLQIITSPLLWKSSRVAYGGMLAQAAARLARQALGLAEGS